MKGMNKIAKARLRENIRRRLGKRKRDCEMKSLGYGESERE